jgi:membrane protease YdiL (CAAX protease family)
VLPALVLVAAIRLGGMAPAEYGLTARAPGPTALHAGLAWLALTVVYFVVGPFLAAGLVDLRAPTWPPIFDLGPYMPPSGPGRALTGVYLAVAAGVVEELMFRGLALAFASRLRSGRFVQLAIFHFVSTVLFAAGHWEQGFGGTVGAGAYGLAAGLIYLRLRALLPLVIAHTALDLAAFW